MRTLVGERGPGTPKKDAKTLPTALLTPTSVERHQNDRANLQNLFSRSVAEWMRAVFSLKVKQPIRLGPVIREEEELPQDFGPKIIQIFRTDFNQMGIGHVKLTAVLPFDVAVTVT